MFFLLEREVLRPPRREWAAPCNRVKYSLGMRLYCHHCNLEHSNHMQAASRTDRCYHAANLSLLPPSDLPICSLLRATGHALQPSDIAHITRGAAPVFRRNSNFLPDLRDAS